jgi:hypothetical protein
MCAFSVSLVNFILVQFVILLVDYVVWMCASQQKAFSQWILLYFGLLCCGKQLFATNE